MAVLREVKKKNYSNNTNWIIKNLIFAQNFLKVQEIQFFVIIAYFSFKKNPRNF